MGHNHRISHTADPKALSCSRIHHRDTITMRRAAEPVSVRPVPLDPFDRPRRQLLAVTRPRSFLRQPFDTSHLVVFSARIAVEIPRRV